MMAVYAGLFGYLSVQRQRAFWTGRFDVGNMVQAVWSTAQGRPLETTDILGRQFTRLGAHVNPILVLFTPLTWTGHLPEALLVSQAVIVATGALPAFWLGRRWLGDDRLAVAAAAVYLLYPPLQWTTVTEFHPVTLAAPLLHVLHLGGRGAPLHDPDGARRARRADQGGGGPGPGGPRRLDVRPRARARATGRCWRRRRSRGWRSR